MLVLNSAPLLFCRLHRASPAASSPAGPSVLYTYMPLIARATQAGLVALVRHLMGAVAPADLEAVAAYRVQGGMGLLHLGVQSGKLDILAAVLEASSAECWQVSFCLLSVLHYSRCRHVHLANRL